MDVISDKKVTGLVATEGKTRIYALEDGNWLKASEGTVAWRNNNPGNLKFEYAGSADSTVHTTRSQEKALEAAQSRYDGVVALDQWGNAVFESYEAGREAQKDLLRGHGMRDKTVEDLVKGYSKADYSGNTHHAAQVATIYATAAAQGVDLHGKTVAGMTDKELNALADGLSKAEGWKPGTVEKTPPLSQEELQRSLHAHAAKSAPHGSAPAQHGGAHAYRQGDHGPAIGQLQQDLKTLGFGGSDGHAITADQRFGPRTKEAVEAFQMAHGLPSDGVAGPATLAALAEAKAQVKPGAPSLLDASHPAHGMYAQAYQGVARLDEAQGRTPGPQTQMFAGSLTTAALGAGMQRIDHVLLSDDASRGYAVQGALHSPFKQYAEVNVMQAIQTPLPHSSAQASAQMLAAQPTPAGQAPHLSQEPAQPVVAAPQGATR